MPPWVERHVHKHSVVSVRLVLVFGSTVRCLVALGISFYTNETRNWKVDECSVCRMCKFSNLKRVVAYCTTSNNLVGLRNATVRECHGITPRARREQRGKAAGIW